MATFPVATGARMLGIHSKTLHHWRKRGQSPLGSPSDRCPHDLCGGGTPAFRWPDDMDVPSPIFPLLRGSLDPLRPSRQRSKQVLGLPMRHSLLLLLLCSLLPLLL
jgi:hypothetical protein